MNGQIERDVAGTTHDEGVLARLDRERLEVDRAVLPRAAEDDAAPQPEQEARDPARSRRPPVGRDPDLALGLLWGFAEATIFFVVPDVLVGYLALRSPRRALVSFLSVIAGAVLGAVALYAAIAWLGLDVDGVLGALPGMRPADVDSARAALAAHGPGAMLDGLVQGQPVKLYIDGAARLGLALPSLLLFVVLNRCLRVGLSAIVCSVIGRIVPRVVEERRGLVALLYATFWGGVYAWYWVLRPA